MAILNIVFLFRQYLLNDIIKASFSKDIVFYLYDDKKTIYVKDIFLYTFVHRSLFVNGDFSVYPKGLNLPYPLFKKEGKIYMPVL